MGRVLHPEFYEIGSLSQNLKAKMFEIYARYYEPALRDVFFNDLNNKSHALILRDEGGETHGFSTLKTWVLNQHGQQLQILYSGDTIIEQEYWGSQVLSFSWIEFAGTIKAQMPNIPLYWFLITKGHRTYRYMALFSKKFFPNPDQKNPKFIQELMHQIGTETFPDQYCPNTGIVMHKVDSAALKPEFHVPSLKNKSNREIDFFSQQNPGFESGDELLCLCELSMENLRPMARKQFERGLNIHGMAKTA